MANEKIMIEPIEKVLPPANPTPTPTAGDSCKCINKDEGTLGHHDNRQPLY